MQVAMVLLPRPLSRFAVLQAATPGPTLLSCCDSTLLSVLKVLSIQHRGEQRAWKLVPGEDGWARPRRAFPFIAFCHP